MDKELMELFEQKLMIFSKRDDVEKLRQENNANFRKLKEENKELILGWIEGIRAEMEGLKREGRVDLDPMREEMKEEMKKLELKIEAMLYQSIQPLASYLQQIKETTNSALQPFQQEIGSNLQTMKEEFNTAVLRIGQEMASSLQWIKEEGRTNLVQLKEEMRADLHRSGEGVGDLADQVSKTMEEIVSLHDKIKEGFNEVKEELGSMIKFSYADLEKRFTNLEARIKALEKLVLP